MKPAAMKRRLEALHAQVAGVLVGIEASIADLGESEQPASTQPDGRVVACAHPPEQRENVTTLNDSAPRFRCRACGQDNV